MHAAQRALPVQYPPIARKINGKKMARIPACAEGARAEGDSTAKRVQPPGVRACPPKASGACTQSAFPAHRSAPVGPGRGSCPPARPCWPSTCVESVGQCKRVKSAGSTHLSRVDSPLMQGPTHPDEPEWHAAGRTHQAHPRDGCPSASWSCLQQDREHVAGQGGAPNAAA